MLQQDIDRLQRLIQQEEDAAKAAIARIRSRWVQQKPRWLLQRKHGTIASMKAELDKQEKKLRLLVDLMELCPKRECSAERSAKAHFAKAS